MKTLVIVLALCATLVKSAPTERKSYRNWKLVQVVPVNKEQVSFLKQLETDWLLDFWQFPHINKPAAVMLSPDLYAAFVSEVTTHGMTSKVVIEDLEKSAEDALKPVQNFHPSQTLALDHSKYHTLADVMSNLDFLAANEASVAKKTIGHTEGNKAIEKLEIVSAGGVANKKKIYLEVLAHGREWLTTASMMYFIDMLLNPEPAYAAAAEFMLDNFEWHVVPVSNPDGYDYTWNSDRYWRKNRAQTSSSFCPGVDLNRNFDSNWGGSGSSTSPCSTTYIGPSVESEMETKAITDDIRDMASKPVAYISVHSYSQYLLIPFGWKDNAPVLPNIDDIRSTAETASQAIKTTSGRVFEVGTPWEVLYEAKGTSMDWACMNPTNIPFCVTYELLPSGNLGNDGFSPSADMIVPSGEDLWNSLYAIAGDLNDNKWQPPSN